MENNIKLFSLMAGIEKTWIIEKVELDDNKDLNMYVRFEKGTKFKCKSWKKRGKKGDTYHTA